MRRSILGLLIIYFFCIIFCGIRCTFTSDDDTDSDTKYYSIKYNANGYTDGTIPDEHYELADDQVLIRNVTGDATLFRDDLGMNVYMVGWNTKSDGSGTRYLPYEPITMTENNINLYIEWAESFDSYFSYNGNMQSSGSAPSCYYYDDDTAYIADKGDLVKDGYSFQCWNTESDGSGTDYYPGSTITATTSMDLYAKWVSE